MVGVQCGVGSGGPMWRVRFNRDAAPGVQQAQQGGTSGTPSAPGASGAPAEEGAPAGEPAGGSASFCLTDLLHMLQKSGGEGHVQRG